MWLDIGFVPATPARESRCVEPGREKRANANGECARQTPRPENNLPSLRSDRPLTRFFPPWTVGLRSVESEVRRHRGRSSELIGGQLRLGSTELLLSELEIGRAH